MEQLIKNIIPSIKQYGELLSQKSILQKTWLLVNENGDIIEYTFKSSSELIISINGDVIKGKWELLSPMKILLDSPTGSIQLENLFFNKGIIVLLKPNRKNELFILVDKKVMGEKSPIEYLQQFINVKNQEFVESDIIIIMIMGLIVLIFIIIVNAKHDG